ncbi:MAG: hypothetical protein ABI871_01440 [Chthoniobacterales bacterium]
MPRKNRLLIVTAATIFLVVAAVCLTPLFVVAGLRVWLWQKARQQHLTIEFAGIDAPLLRPLLVRELRIRSQPGAMFRTDFRAPRVEFDLKLLALFGGQRGRVLRSLTLLNPRLEATRAESPDGANRSLDWSVLHDLLADSWEIRGLNGRLQGGGTVVDIHDFSLSASEAESGRFNAGQITLVSPLFRRTFGDLRGATTWMEDRLTIGAITLARGLDLQAITFDFRNLARRQISLDVDVDTFGGRLRAKVSSQEQNNHRAWDIAGSGSGISLAQISDAIGLTEPASGAVRALKFTFRGDTEHMADATASVWAEIASLTWHAHAAETIMFGASLYNHQIEIEQLYIKQQHNELTLSGESPLPGASADWLNPNFRGGLSANIRDLAEFAPLLGGSANAFSGAISVNGTVATIDRKLSGKLDASGHALVLGGAPIDRLEGNLVLEGFDLAIPRLELRRGDDFLRGSGRIELNRAYNYSGTFASEVANIADYRSLLPSPSEGLTRGALKLDWTGNGNASAHHGSFRAQARELAFNFARASPVFDADLEGLYSPDSTYFRRFHLANEHASFDAFATFASNYTQLQTVRLELSGKPRLEGNLFVPLSLRQWKPRNNVLESIEDDANFDIDLRVGGIDLAELGSAIRSNVPLHGSVAGSIAAYGTLAAPDVAVDARGRDVALRDPAPISGNVHFAARDGQIAIGATILPPGSSLARMATSARFTFDHEKHSYDFDMAGPLSASLDFPSILLGKFPAYCHLPPFTDGTIGGKLAIAGSVRNPKITGQLRCADLRWGDPLAFFAQFTFGGTRAAIDSAKLETASGPLPLRGSLDLADSAALSATVSLFQPARDLTPPTVISCIDSVEVVRSNAADSAKAPLVNSFMLRGSALDGNWTVSLLAPQGRDGDASPAARTFGFCRRKIEPGKKLVLGIAPAALR